jgi:hypothetical protein
MNEEELNALAQSLPTVQTVQAAPGLSFEDLNAIASQVSQEIQAPSPTDDMERQLGLTGRALAQGGAGLVGLAYDPIAAIQNLLVGPEGLMPLSSENVRPLREQVKDVLTSAGVPEPDTATERVVGAVSEAMAAGGIQAKLAQVLAPILSGTSSAVSSQLAAQPAQQVAGAGGGGAGAQIAAEAGGGPATQFAAGLLGGGLGGRAAGLEARATPADVPQAIREAEGAGVRVMTTDVRGPDTFAGKWLQKAGEMIPYAGTGGPRAAQQTERSDAAADLLRNYGVAEGAAAGETTLAAVTRDLLKTRGDNLIKYTNMKKGVISDLQDAGPVDVSRTISKIDEEIAKLRNLRTGNVNPVIERLEDWRRAISGSREVTMPGGATRIEQRGQPITNIEELRKNIGDAFKDPNLASVRGIGEKALGRIYAPLRKDMGDFIKANGERRDYDKWQVANRNLSNMAGELGVGVLKSALAKGDATPEVVRSMIFSTKPSDMRVLYKNLSPQGKANARTAVLQEAFQKAGGEFENLSPDRIKQSVSRLGKSVNVFFSGEDLKAVEGLVRTLKITERAGQASVSPPTGVQALPVVGAAFLTDIFGGMGGATVSAATIGGLSRVYESKAVRNLLLKIPQVAIGSAEEAELVKRLADATRALSASDRAEQ